MVVSMAEDHAEGMSQLEEAIAFGGLVVAIAALLITPYGVEAVLAYVCLASWRVQAHNKRSTEWTEVNDE